jgi:hypothetical protein
MTTSWFILAYRAFKLRDAGTTRSIVMQDNQEALLITYAWRKYTGDSYVVRRPKLQAKSLAHVG